MLKVIFVPTILSFQVSFIALCLGCFCQPHSGSALWKDQVSPAGTLPTLSPAAHTPSAWPRTRPAKNRCLCKWTVDLSSLVMHSPFGRKSRKWVFGLISETSSLPFLHNLFDVWWGFEDLNLNIYKGMSEHIAVCKGTHSRLHEFF